MKGLRISDLNSENARSYETVYWVGVQRVFIRPVFAIL